MTLGCVSTSAIDLSGEEQQSFNCSFVVSMDSYQDISSEINVIFLSLTSSSQV